MTCDLLFYVGISYFLQIEDLCINLDLVWIHIQGYLGHPCYMPLAYVEIEDEEPVKDQINRGVDREHKPSRIWVLGQWS